MAHCGGAYALAVGQDLPPPILDVARVPAALIVADGHQCRAAVSPESRDRGGVVEVEPTVPVEDRELLSQGKEGAGEGAAGAEEDRAVWNVTDHNPEASAVPHRCFDLLAAVARKEEGLPESVSREETQLVESERFPSDLYEGLRNRFGNWTQ